MDVTGSEIRTATPLDKFSLANLPPEGHEQVGPFFYTLYQAALTERRRLELEERWMENHRLYRGDHHGPHRRVIYKNKKKKQTINLLFANIIRTAANITSRQPVAEVVSTDGIEDGMDIVLSQKIKNWWNDTEQGASLGRSALNNEIYGVTTEKAVYNQAQGRADIVVKDCFSVLPAPGNYEEWNDCPYMVDLDPMQRSLMAKMFGVDMTNVEVDDVYSLLGEDREDNRPIPAGTYFGTQNYPGNYTQVQHPKYGPTNIKEERSLAVEIWIRDYTREPIQEMVGEKPVTDPETGEVVVDPESGLPVMEPVFQVIGYQDKYPGNIRVVTLTNHGRMVLDDKPNPNVNLKLPREWIQKTYLYDHYPFFKANSYEDTTSPWGFASAEQVGDLNLIIDDIMTRIIDYVIACTKPPLVIPKDTGITRQDIKNGPGLILRPISTASAQGIRFLQVPSLPSDFFNALDILVKFFDRISAIEDADRGNVPNRVVSGAAIAALQERGAVLVRAKIRAIDYLVRSRGRCAISFFQNFGVYPELINAQGTTQEVRGLDLAQREFNYVVESGSTVAKTSLQVQEQAEALYEKGAIDRQALLETLNFPNWKEIVERVSEGQLGQAVQILIQAGLPEDIGMTLYQYLIQPQGGPGNRPQDAGAGKENRAGQGGSALAKSEQGQVGA